MSSLRKRRTLSQLLASSFPGKGLPQTSDGPAIAPAVQDSLSGDADTYPSRALAEWWNRMDESEQRRVLDLGTVGAETLRFLSEHGCYLSVLDLDVPVSTDDPDDRLASFTQQLASADAGDTYGGALLWDLLNYLDERETRLLGQWLSQRLMQGGAVLACVSTRGEVRSEPGLYRIVDEQTILQRDRGEATDRRASMTQAKLRRLWPEFNIARSYLLRNGMQEFVLVRQ